MFPDTLPDNEPPDRGIGHPIPLKPGARPMSRPLYRMSPLELEEVRTQVADMLRKGQIEPSTSPWGAAIVFARKADGSRRMCVD